MTCMSVKRYGARRERPWKNSYEGRQAGSGHPDEAQISEQPLISVSCQSQPVS